MESEQKDIKDFNAIRLSVASPDDILNWSYGEVIRPETINYRTQKPEKDGLFCERIFGPTKDWECYCGKYKKIRYKGIICDKCGVEVTRSIVRRERMGHIQLAVPVSHIWFLKGVPSKIGLLLGMATAALEKVIYFVNYIITEVNEKEKAASLEQIEKELKAKRKEVRFHFKEEIAKIKNEYDHKMKEAKEAAKEELNRKYLEALSEKKRERNESLKRLEDAAIAAREELRSLVKLNVISESAYRDLSLKYGHVFKAGIGAEAVQEIVKNLDLKKLAAALEREKKKAGEAKRRKVLRRLEIIYGFLQARIKPEWMFITVLPVMPPDLRPMVQLDGGRFASSDLNDLYRRVINRNNRLKHLIELGAPEVICRNEKRMLQEAVDALIDNTARRGEAVMSSTGQRRVLRSIADMLKGKQGRFRQNLLGKRVDYSGRSVIVVGPELKMGQCGLPKIMALELFKPFVIRELINRGQTHNIRSAVRMIEEEDKAVWDALEDVVRERKVLLNRAPTLHRLGIQAFSAQLIEGKAIQIHPLVCAPFNADFDGDQMAVHIPLSQQAKKEANDVMASTENLLKPADGKPATAASQDIVLGCYYLTAIRKGTKGEGNIFSSKKEALLAYNTGFLDLQAKIKVLDSKGKLLETSVGRLIFNEVLPLKTKYINKAVNKKILKEIIAESLYKSGSKKTVEFMDKLKELGFRYATISGFTWGMDDLKIPKEKKEIIQEAEREVENIKKQFEMGLLTEDERYERVIEIWSGVREKIADLVSKTLEVNGSVYSMVQSGARGSWAQTVQMTGMKGLVTNPAGRTIELPIKSSFKEGFDVLEYFISTHGARKGMADTALRTATAGYLTRRLVDVAQDVVVRGSDCGDKEGVEITREDSEEMNESFADSIFGRTVLQDIIDPRTKKKIAKKGDVLDQKIAKKIDKIPSIKKIRIRSVMTCKLLKGVCQRCYGFDLGTDELVKKGESVGIVAAQSIGEPGTQLTMRTFHTGGVAGGGDITQGLPRVEEIFEVRPPKGEALMSEINGKVKIEETEKETKIKIYGMELPEDSYSLRGKKKVPSLRKGVEVKEKEVIAVDREGRKIKAKKKGKVIKVSSNELIIQRLEPEVREYIVPPNLAIWVKDGNVVKRGDQLTEGHLNLRKLYRVAGTIPVQKYIIKEIKKIYTAQGEAINNKHIEIIIRQMFSKVRIKKSGDTMLLPGRVVDKATFEMVNKEVAKKKGKVATGEDLLLGITKASLSTSSFLSAASFQETARVLIDAAVSGRVDYLEGLKENVIIGKLIPAGTGYREKRNSNNK